MASSVPSSKKNKIKSNRGFYKDHPGNINMQIEPSAGDKERWHLCQIGKWCQVKTTENGEVCGPFRYTSKWIQILNHVLKIAPAAYNAFTANLTPASPVRKARLFLILWRHGDILIVCPQARQQAQIRHQMAEDSKADYSSILQKFNHEQREYYHSHIPSIFQVSDLHFSGSPFLETRGFGVSIIAGPVDYLENPRSPVTQVTLKSIQLKHRLAVRWNAISILRLIGSLCKPLWFAIVVSDLRLLD